MKPIVKISPSETIDESFAKIAEKIIQDYFNKVPDALWAEAYRDIAAYGQVQMATFEKIGKFISLQN